MDAHRRIEKRSLSLHRAVADKLLGDPAGLAKARDRVKLWLRDGSVHRRYSEAWHEVLSLEPEEVAKHLVDPGETMCALRQCSPFAGALAPGERWRILRQAKKATGS